MKWTPVKRGMVAALVAWGVLGSNYIITQQREAALCRFASDSNASEVSKLLAQGTNPNAIAYYELSEGGHSTSTPLIALVDFEGSNKNANRIAETLIAAGADVNKPDTYGATPLSTANDLEIVNILLKHGANPNFRPQKNADTPLLAAIFKGNLGKVKRLIEVGADVNARNAGGLSPLDLARKCVTGYAQEEAESAIVDVLTKAGATPSPEQ